MNYVIISDIHSNIKTDAGAIVLLGNHDLDFLRARISNT